MPTTINTFAGGSRRGFLRTVAIVLSMAVPSTSAPPDRAGFLKP